MNQKKNRGFTLIELLAVIVILAIIALIAVPIIMNIINKANKSAFKDSAYGIISAGELYFAEMQLEPNGMMSDVVFEFPNNMGNLQIKGEIPNGIMIVNTFGEIAIGLKNNIHCITKDYKDKDKDLTVTEDIENCKMPVPIYSNGIASSENICLKEGVCPSGTLMKVNVNKNDVYNFYVISDDGNEMVLIMDRNLYSEEDQANGTHNVPWINAEDYALANADDNTVCEDSVCSDEGPLTAVKVLKVRTNNWTNIPEREYTYKDDGGNVGYKYSSFKEMMRAKLLTYKEVDKAKKENNDIIPEWLYINLKNTGNNNSDGYWLSSANPWSDGAAYAMRSYDDKGRVSITSVSEGNIGIRPVITLTK